MTLKEKIMKLQTYKMFVGEDTVYVERDDVLKLLGQEPRKGHWKLVQRGKYIDVCCSNCKAVRIKDYAYNYTIDRLNKEDLKECFECADMRYCPNCGAEMSEVEDGE